MKIVVRIQRNHFFWELATLLIVKKYMDIYPRVNFDKAQEITRNGRLVSIRKKDERY